MKSSSPVASSISFTDVLDFTCKPILPFRIALLSRYGKWYGNWPMLYVQRYPWTC